MVKKCQWQTSGKQPGQQAIHEQSAPVLARLKWMRSPMRGRGRCAVPWWPQRAEHQQNQQQEQPQQRAHSSSSHMRSNDVLSSEPTAFIGCCCDARDANDDVTMLLHHYSAVWSLNQLWILWTQSLLNEVDGTRSLAAVLKLFLVHIHAVIGFVCWGCP